MNMRELLLPPGATRHDWLIDIAITVGFSVATVLPYLTPSAVGKDPDWLEVIASALMVVPLVVRRHSPLIMMALCAVAGTMQVVVSEAPLASVLVVPVVVYSVARHIPGSVARSVLVIGLLGSLIGPVRWFVWGSETVSLNDLTGLLIAILVCLGLLITPYAFGRRIREAEVARQHGLLAAEERYALLLAEREQQNRLAEAKARAMIARELHDIVAHSLSVMIIQAEGGRALAARKPEAALEALDTIAETGREALQEMRRIVGVLRAEPADEDSTAYAPTPTLADIPELVQRTSDRVRLDIVGQPPRVSQALGLTGYRVVQEGLTNFLKYAGNQAHAVVTLTYTPDLIAVDIVDDGVGPATVSPDDAGHGIRGMRERVVAMGGDVTVGPLPQGGYRVHATIPVTRVS